MAELVITRVFDAPRDAVFKAFTEPEHLTNWWGGSRTSKITVEKLHLVPGGKFIYSSKHSEDSPKSYGLFVYTIIDSPSSIEFVSGFTDETEEFTRASFSPSFPMRIRNIWTFQDVEGGKTSLTMRGSPLNGTGEEMEFFVSMLEPMRGGFGGTFDQLSEYLLTLA